MKNMEARFQSVFSAKLTAFIEEKQALGYRYIAAIKLLKDFDKTMAANNVASDHLDERAVALWIAKRSGEKGNNQLSRISSMRVFAEYLHRRGEGAFMCAYPHQKDIQVYQPYIFDRFEVKRIFAAADAMEYTSKSPRLHLTTPMITKTLYGTGMRISEVLKLKRKDVNLSQNCIMARDTKNGKERLLPISGSLATVYEQYISQQRFAPGDYLFTGKHGAVLDKENYYYAFRRLLEKAGIAHMGRGGGPRVHDFRHTFSVHRLNQWAREGKDMNAMLPILAVYLGHENVRIASYYLRLTAQVFPEMTAMVERDFGEVIPDILAKEREALHEYT